MVGEGVEFPEIAAKKFTVNFFLFPFFLTFFFKKNFCAFSLEKDNMCIWKCFFCLKKKKMVGFVVSFPKFERQFTV